MLLKHQRWSKYVPFAVPSCVAPSKLALRAMLTPCRRARARPIGIRRQPSNRIFRQQGPRASRMANTSCRTLPYSARWHDFLGTRKALPLPSRRSQFSSSAAAPLKSAPSHTRNESHQAEATPRLITCPASSLWTRRRAKCTYQRAARHHATRLRPRVWKPRGRKLSARASCV